MDGGSENYIKQTAPISTFAKEFDVQIYDVKHGHAIVLDQGLQPLPTPNDAAEQNRLQLEHAWEAAGSAIPEDLNRDPCQVSQFEMQSKYSSIIPAAHNDICRKCFLKSSPFLREGLSQSLKSFAKIF
jgi:hypothetical protein